LPDFQLSGLHAAAAMQHDKQRQHNAAAAQPVKIVIDVALHVSLPCAGALVCLAFALFLFDAAFLAVTFCLTSTATGAAA